MSSDGRPWRFGGCMADGAGRGAANRPVIRLGYGALIFPNMVLPVHGLQA